MNPALKFFELDNNQNDLGSTGRFSYGGNEMIIDGYCFFNNSHRAFILIATGPNVDNVRNKVDRILNSIKYTTLR